MKKLAKRIKEKIIHHEEDHILIDKEDKVIELKKENFKDIKKQKIDKKVAYLDGGNLEVIKSPSLSLFFNRIYYTVYEKGKRINSDKFEFFTLISAEDKENKIVYRTENYFTDKEIKLGEYEFDSFDKTLKTGENRVSVSFIGNVIRRFAELGVASQIKQEIVIIDGSLEAKYTHEKELIERLLKKKVVCGISKTTELLTKKGNSATAHLEKLTDKGKWYYKVGSDNLYLAKFHPGSKYVFRVEINKENKVGEIMSLLGLNSRDPVFLGYPYALIEADRFARVSQKERENIQIQLKFLLKKDFEKIRPYLNSVNAHEILDNIS